MCTVIIEIPEREDRATRVLAVRDELPSRPWDPPGRWWADHPEVRGVRDRLAGGAWLAAHDDGGLAVILNRSEEVESHVPLESRGGIVLDAVLGAEVPDRPRTQSFNLVEARGGRARISQWAGETLTQTVLEPGVHMIAHSGINDFESARIAEWLPVFQALQGVEDWQTVWMEALTEREFGKDDDRAIIRDNTVHGFPTQSLLVCLAEVKNPTVEVSYAQLTEPAVWGNESLKRAS